MSIKTNEEEIDRIRLRIYEETKDLTPEEYTERVRKIGEEVAKEFGLKILSREEFLSKYPECR